MPYVYDPEKITYFAATNARGKRTAFGIRAKDRSKHVYVIGKTGMGKSTMLENMAIQDIQGGEGLCFIDPHGSTAEKLLSFVPEHRIKDVLYFAPFDVNSPIGFNVMEDVGYDRRHLVVAGLMSAFKRIWVDAWSARMEYILQNTLLALLEYPDTTLLDVNRMLTNKQFRNQVTDRVTDPVVKRFWREEFAGYTDRYTQEATPAIQNKIGQFTSNPLIRNIVGQSTSTFDMRTLMDTRKIFIVNLAKGRIGEQNADLLGSMITTKLYLAALSRAEETPLSLSKLPPFYLYVDEFQSIANDSFADILSEARKYKLCLTIAHQYIEQLEENIRFAVFGNVGTTITFRVGPFDAEVLKTVFEPTFTAEDLVGLGFASVYLSLMIDGVGSHPFSAMTLPPVDDPPFSFVEKIVTTSRERYSRNRVTVEAEIRARTERIDTAPQQHQPQQSHQQGSNKKKKNKNRNTESPLLLQSPSRAENLQVAEVIADDVSAQTESNFVVAPVISQPSESKPQPKIVPPLKQPVESVVKNEEQKEVSALRKALNEALERERASQMVQNTHPASSSSDLLQRLLSDDAV